MAQHRAPTAGKYRREAVAVPGDAIVANRENTSVNCVQSSCRLGPRDCGRRVAKFERLPLRYDAMLAGGQAAQGLVVSHFSPHMKSNGSWRPNSPPAGRLRSQLCPHTGKKSDIMAWERLFACVEGKYVSKARTFRRLIGSSFFADR